MTWLGPGRGARGWEPGALAFVKSPGLTEWHGRLPLPRLLGIGGRVWGMRVPLLPEGSRGANSAPTQTVART